MQYETYRQVYISLCIQNGGFGLQKTDKEIWALYRAYQRREGMEKMRDEVKRERRKTKSWFEPRVRTLGEWIAKHILRPAWLFLFRLEKKMMGESLR